MVGHRVTLPHGYHATQEAIDQARHDGIILRDGETYRRKHTRGNPELGIITGNRAVKQNIL